MKRFLHIPLFLFAIGGILTLSPACKSKKAVSNSNTVSAVSGFDDYFIDAVTHYNNTNYETSLKLFVKCIDLKPEQAAPYYYASKIKFNSEYKSTQGLQYASKAYSLATSNIEYATWYASKLKIFNQIDLAIEVLEKTYSLNPKDENLAQELDRLYSRKALVDKQILLWQNLIKEKGFSLKYASRLIALHKNNKDLASAHQVYEQIESAAPKKYQYIVENGNLYLEEGNSDKAFECFDRALKVNPNIWEVNKSLFNYYFDKNDSNKALQYLRQGLSDPGTNFQVKASTIAKIKTRADSDSGMAIYLKTIADIIKNQYFDDGTATSIGAYCYEYIKSYPDALLLYKRSVSLNSNYNAYLGVIRLEEMVNGANAAMHAVDSALELYPNVSDLYLMGSEIAFRAKLYPQSVEYASNGLRYSIDLTSKTKLYACIINAYLANGEMAKALEESKKSLTILPDNPQLLELLGDIYLKSGLKNEAEASWRKAIDNGGDKNNLNLKISEINKTK